MIYGFIKRALDCLICIAAVLILWPVMIALGIAVRLSSPGPAIFKQRRVGRDGKIFTIYKYRTMYLSAPSDTPTHKLTKAKAYITPLGRFMRKSSLDELPQVFNIIKGDMALVGPRPALPSQRDLLAAREKLGANAVRPGLTGWAQINGRDSIPISQKARLDGEYVKRMSLAFDLRCLCGTVGCVFSASGVREGTQADKK